MYAIFKTPADGWGWQRVEPDQAPVPGEVGRQATQPPDPFVWDGTQARSPTESEALDVPDEFGLSPRKNKRVAIDAAHQRQRDAGIEFEGHRYQSDKASREEMQSTLDAINAGLVLPANFTWRCADDHAEAMDADKLKRLWQAIFTQGWALFQQRSALKDAVSVASTQAAVDAITLPPEWTA